MTHSVKLTALYLRRSTGGQEASLEQQQSECEKYASAHGLEVGAVYSDTRTGIELWERDGMSALREAISRREYGHLVVYALDRLARKVSHQIIIAEECSRYGVTLHSVTEPLDSSPEGILILSVKGYVAEVEREKIRERTIRGKLAKLRSGKWIWGSQLYGYRTKSGERTVHEYESGVVRQIFALCCDGISQHQIARILTAETSRTWSQSQVRKLLRNPAYKGVAVTLSRKGSERIVLPEGTVPAIVPAEVWDQAQQKISESRGDWTRNQRRRYLLRGMIFCASCASRMYGTPNRSRGRTYRIYRCAKRCSPQVLADRIEREVWYAVANELADPDRMADLVDTRDDTLALIQQIESLERDVRRVDSRASAVLDELADRPSLADVGRRKLDEYERQKAALRKRIDSLRMALDRENATAKQKRAVLSFAADLKGRLADPSWETMREVLERVQVRVLAHRHESEVEMLIPVPDGPAYAIRNRQRNRDSRQ